MNERIQELAMQAYIADSLQRNPNYKKSYITDLLIKDLAGFNKKFAELIVKECAIIANRADNTETEIRCMYDVITEHFGVEE